MNQTTALDVTIQAQILDLIRELLKWNECWYNFNYTWFRVVAELADRVLVMYAGEVVEMASVYDLFKNPKHPYTRSLLSSIPQLDVVTEELNVISGTVPSLKNLPRNGCRFSERIPWIKEEEHEKNFYTTWSREKDIL